MCLCSFYFFILAPFIPVQVPCGYEWKEAIKFDLEAQSTRACITFVCVCVHPSNKSCVCLFLHVHKKDDCHSIFLLLINLLQYTYGAFYMLINHFKWKCLMAKSITQSRLTPHFHCLFMFAYIHILHIFTYCMNIIKMIMNNHFTYSCACNEISV